MMIFAGRALARVILRSDCGVGVRYAAGLRRIPEAWVGSRLIGALLAI